MKFNWVLATLFGQYPTNTSWNHTSSCYISRDIILPWLIILMSHGTKKRNLCVLVCARSHTQLYLLPGIFLQSICGWVTRVKSKEWESWNNKKKLNLLLSKSISTMLTLFEVRCHSHFSFLCLLHDYLFSEHYYKFYTFLFPFLYL